MRKGIVTAVALGVLVAGGVWLSLNAAEVVLADTGEANAYQLLTTFNNVLRLIKDEYVEDRPLDELIYGAISGMLGTLDPHSSMLETADYENLNLRTTGKFGGLGMQVQITTEDNTLTVMSPFDGTPASEAGLLPGDKILEIDGESTYELTINESVDMMRGEPGSEVTLTIARAGVPGTIAVTLTRAEVEVDSVPDHFITSPGVGYVRISDFSEDTDSELELAVRQLLDEGMEWLILDLRDNPGGTLNAAASVSEMFSSGTGELIVYTEGRNTEATHTEFRTTNGGYKVSVPVALVINNGSASASEILTGALKAWDRAVVFGVTSFGKGSVQQVYPLDRISTGGAEDRAVKLTIARYYTPDGVCIDEIGIDPHVYLEPNFYTAFASRFIAAGYHRQLTTEFRLEHGEGESRDDFEALDDAALAELIIAFMEEQEDPFDYTPGEVEGETLDQLRIALTAQLITQEGGVDGPSLARRYRIANDKWISEVIRLMEDEQALTEAQERTIEKLAELAEERENQRRRLW
jgi:carboxyl-terminal processing protease